jgi:hypothetical protein
MPVDVAYASPGGAPLFFAANSGLYRFVSRCNANEHHMCLARGSCEAGPNNGVDAASCPACPPSSIVSQS